jgi:putative phosphonate metabolism protein
LDPAPRYAIYYAPPSGGTLWKLASRWLGRDAATGQRLEQPRINGFSPARLAEITADAARYGFHATLKAPFALAPDRSRHDLAARAAAFAREQAAFRGPRLVLGALDGFIALVPDQPQAALRALADAAVVHFDDFRNPPRASELERRRAAGLTLCQDQYLERWGYPYVFEAWQFHMTLTSRLEAIEFDRLRPALADYFGPGLADHDGAIDSICLFVQPDRMAPFQLSARFPFAR